MTIDEAIKVLEQHHMWTGEPQEIIDVRVENSAMSVAIETMRKYQKIEQIYKEWFSDAGRTSADAYVRIGEVLKDGNDD